MFSHIKLVFSGLIIGIANIIPGVSGGTMAVVLGVYEKLMEAIGEFFTNKEKRKEYFFTLLKIGLGAIVGIFLFAKLLKYLLTNYNEPTAFFFMGLILGSVPFVYKEIQNTNKKTPLLSGITFIIGFALVLILSFAFKTVSTADSVSLNFNALGYVKLIISGFIASGTMVIPGVSGSFMLILLGEYERILKMVSMVKSQTVWLPLAVFGVGVVLGIIFFAKLMNYLLKHFHQATMAFILGLVLASLVKVYPGFSQFNILLSVAAFLVGLILAVAPLFFRRKA